MSENTPNRGYTYPEYTDPTNFPAQIQDLAQDIDADVQGLLDQIEHSREDAPSASIFGDGGSLAANTNTNMSFASIDFDNAAMTGTPNVLTITVAGLYLCSSWLRLTDDLLTREIVYGMRFNTSTFAAQTLRMQSGDTSLRLSLTGLVFLNPADTVSIITRTTAITGLQERYLSATRISGNVPLP